MKKIFFVFLAVLFLFATFCSKQVNKEKLYGRWERGDVEWFFRNNGKLIVVDNMYKTVHLWDVNYSNKQNYIIIDTSQAIPFRCLKNLLILDKELEDGDNFVMKRVKD